MKICVTQREGIRHFSRFTDLGERDKLYIEVTVEDKNGGKPVLIDLTAALIQEYSKHPELGKISPVSVEEIVHLRPIKSPAIKAAKEVSPAYLEESKKQKDEVLARVREAQQKLADQRKRKAADQAAARAERLAAARKAKAEKEAAKRKGPGVQSKKTRTENAKLTRTQQAAIKKIGKALAKEEKTKTTAAKSKPAAKPSTQSSQTAKTAKTASALNNNGRRKATGAGPGAAGR